LKNGANDDGCHFIVIPKPASTVVYDDGDDNDDGFPKTIAVLSKIIADGLHIKPPDMV